MQQEPTDGGGDGRRGDRRSVKGYKYPSKHLRHQPERLGLTLDEGGRAEIGTLIAVGAAHGFHFTR